jgi:hypothetical protein
MSKYLASVFSFPPASIAEIADFSAASDQLPILDLPRWFHIGPLWIVGWTLDVALALSNDESIASCLRSKVGGKPSPLRR